MGFEKGGFFRFQRLDGLHLCGKGCVHNAGGIGSGIWFIMQTLGGALPLLHGIVVGIVTTEFYFCQFFIGDVSKKHYLGVAEEVFTVDLLRRLNTRFTNKSGNDFIGNGTDA